MKKIVFVLLCIAIIGCSTEKEQMETVRELAKKDIINYLQLPEGTLFTEKDITVSEKTNGIEGIGATFVVKVAVVSQDANGNKNSVTHILEYVKIGEGGLSQSDYELQSFD
jgi:hypothetical protein